MRDTLGFADLDEPALHVSSLGSLHGSVHQTLSTSHSVEEELGGSQTRVETILHKSLGIWGLGYRNMCKVLIMTKFIVIHVSIFFPNGRGSRYLELLYKIPSPGQ